MKDQLNQNIFSFDPSRKIIEDVGGAVELLDDAGGCAAAWTFAELMIGWNKKHAQAAYVQPTAILAPRCWAKVQILTAIWRR